jgi:hypothetical protein
MPKFVVERNWIELIGPIWMPVITCAQRKELRAYDIENIRDDEGDITRDSVERWLAMNSGDFQHVEDFAAYIENVTIPWKNEESEFIYNDLTG